MKSSNMKLRAAFIFLLAYLQINHSYQNDITIINKVRFPYGGPFMGIFLAIAMPLEIPEPEVFVSYNFEANYELPENDTTFEFPPDVGNALSVARKQVYNALEFKIESHGYPGRDCLLRAICETSVYSMQHTGVLADILHVVLTPSTSMSENLAAYESAETYGIKHKNCKKYEKNCSISFLKLITFIGDRL